MEKFYTVEAKDGKQEAAFLMAINVGEIRNKGDKGTPVFDVPSMVEAANNKLFEHISKRPTKNRRDWEDMTAKLLGIVVYWSMMQRLGFTSLPITVDTEQKYFGHPLCLAVKEDK